MTTNTASGRRPWRRVSAWAIGLGIVVVLGASVGAGVLIGRSTKDSTASAKGLASEEVVAMIDGSLAAFNRGDWKTFATYWNENAIMEDAAVAKEAMGRSEIVDLSRSYWKLGARYYRISPVIQRGDLASYAVSCPNCPLRWSGIDIVQFDPSFKTTHLWTGNTAGSVPTGPVNTGGG